MAGIRIFAPRGIEELEEAVNNYINGQSQIGVPLLSVDVKQHNDPELKDFYYAVVVMGDRGRGRARGMTYESWRAFDYE